MIKKIFSFFIAIVFLLVSARSLLAQEKKTISLYFFWSKTCPHCAKEKPFLEKLIKKYPQVKLYSLEISDPNNIQLWQKLGEKLKVKIGAIPFTVIGNDYFTGFFSEETTGKQIETALKGAINNGCDNLLQDVLPEVASSPCPSPLVKISNLPETIKLPLIGELTIKNLSLPVLTLVLGLIDGFNPCAMWTLLFLISLLLGMEDRRKMWLLGSAFIISSAFVYFLFLSAWLNFFLFVGVISWVKLAIGLIALGVGSYSVHTYYKNKDKACTIIAEEKRKSTFAKIKKVVLQKEFILAMLGIIFLAFSVNLVELLCSLGLPAIYTQVLTLNKLPVITYYLYLLGYIFFYMLDDMIIFILAMITLKTMGIESKYGRFSHLIGGIIMIIIGILMLFKPEWLMFG